MGSPCGGGHRHKHDSARRGTAREASELWGSAVNRSCKLYRSVSTQAGVGQLVCSRVADNKPVAGVGLVLPLVRREHPRPESAQAG